MDIDKKKQAQALAKAKKILSDAEKKREAARVETSVQSFMNGQYDILSNDELVENLPSYILNKYILDEQAFAVDVLQEVGKSLCNENGEIRERSLMVLSVFSEIIIEERFTEFQEIVADILIEWLQIEEEFIAGFEFVCSQLQEMILIMLSDENWQMLENRISVLQQVASGTVVKNNLIRGVAARIHENLADPDILAKLVTAYLEENNENRDAAANLLKQFGRFAVMFLIQKMIYSNDKEDRYALIELIPQIGEVSVPILQDCLDEKPQWFVIRNIIFIISRLEDPELFSMVEQYLGFPDIRVQQQAISCIEMLGGPQMRKRLIDALGLVNDDLRGQLIDNLGQFMDDEVGEAFISMLNHRDSLSRHVRDDLVLKLCIRLRQYRLPSTVSSLQKVIEERREQFGESDRILKECLISVEQLSVGVETNEALKNEIAEDLNHDEIRIDEAILVEELDEEENLLFSDEEMDDLVAGGEESIEDVSGSGHRDGENNENATRMLESNQDQHLLIWSKLYDEMNSEEANAFFSFLKPMTFKAGEKIVDRNESSSTIYFIDGGFGGLSYNVDDKELLLSSLQAGELIGCEGLYQNKQWSVSFFAQTDLLVRILEQSAYEEIVQYYPELSEILDNYCNHHDVLPYLVNLIEGKDSEPQDQPISVVGETSELIEEAVNGSLMYVARGGFNFVFDFLDSPDSLLGRQVSTKVSLSDGSETTCFGVIAGAGVMEDDSTAGISVFVKFYTPLNHTDYTCSAVTLI